MRRIKFDLSMYFKILHGLVDLSSDTLFQVRDIRTRNNGLTLYKAKFNCNIERYSFKNRSVNIWNLLPENVVSSNELSLFNSRLNSLDMIPLIRKAFWGLSD